MNYLALPGWPCIIEDTTNLARPANQSITDTSLGLKVGAEISCQVTQLMDIFEQYRFTNFESQHVFEWPVVPTETFNTHHLIARLSIRFERIVDERGAGATRKGP